MNDYFIPNFFPMRFCKMVIISCFLASFDRTTDEVEYYGVSLLNSEFLDVWGIRGRPAATIGLASFRIGQKDHFFYI